MPLIKTDDVSWVAAQSELEDRPENKPFCAVFKSPTPINRSKTLKRQT